MRIVYRLELITITLISLYQLANKSSDEKFLSIDKMVFFIVFGIYSFIHTTYSAYFIKARINANALGEDFDKLNVFVGTLLYCFTGILIFLNVTLNSRIYSLNLLFGLVFILKALLFGFIFYRINEKERST